MPVVCVLIMNGSKSTRDCSVSSNITEAVNKQNSDPTDESIDTGFDAWIM